jgi:hypothetical protein
MDGGKLIADLGVVRQERWISHFSSLPSFVLVFEKRYSQETTSLGWRCA